MKIKMKCVCAEDDHLLSLMIRKGEREEFSYKAITETTTTTVVTTNVCV